ncbi:TonB-dependent receptor plug domain-containing protein [Bermanella sp. WJH001]|uniref:TonB-dependent receptor plug domain-containing protein n=1 Tax=Bermanella sp. WJH001 TaxID=3048005 RepID=UPI0024BDD3FE|nr:TonB-dependent receptor [Bermanella sp. WJH001]MDJ1537494.1 TonB-dependent receptor [Bermanella sp. WJH001]
MAYRAVKASLLTICIAPLGWANDMLGGETFAAMDGMFYEQVMEMPEVLTAARLRQSQLDTPASVTVIEAETIAALGFKDIEEIFRLVPGMLVGYHSGFGEKAPSVSYHGTNAPEHRRLQVLIDGRSVFKPGLARVEWVDIPLAVEDIARIEVIRGPNAATYGANSYLGTINILTKHPSDAQGRVVKVTAGNRDVLNSYVNISDRLVNSDFRLTLGSKKKSGFDFYLDGTQERENRDGLDANYAMLRTFTSFSSSFSMEWQAGYKHGVNEQLQTLDENLIMYLEPEDVIAEDAFLWTRFNKEFSRNQVGQIQVYSEQFKRTTEWKACLTSLAALGFGVAQPCGKLNQNLDERKSEFEYQHTSTWNSDFRTVAGIRYRLDQLDSQTYNGGYSENINTSAFINVEYKLGDLVTTNLGGMYEFDDLNGENFSPRYALNLHLNQNHTIRFIYSEAIRSPDIYEKEGRRTITIEGSSLSGAGDDPFIYGQDFFIEGVWVATGQVSNESIHSHEISYFGILRDLGLQIDTKIFYDELNGLISQSLDHDPELPLSSENHINQSGFEGQIKWDMNHENQLVLSFSRIKTDDDFSSNNSKVDRESSLTAERSGSLSWINYLSKQTTLGMVYYHVDNWNVPRRPETDGFEFQRLDLTASHEVKLHENYTLELKGTLQYRLDDDPLLYEANNYDDKEHYYFSAQLNF